MNSTQDQVRDAWAAVCAAQEKAAAAATSISDEWLFVEATLRTAQYQLELADPDVASQDVEVPHLEQVTCEELTRSAVALLIEYLNEQDGPLPHQLNQAVVSLTDALRVIQARPQ